MSDKVFGYDLQDILDGQQRKGKLVSNPIDLSKTGDYGADPIGDGTFRMIPSGDIVDFEERNKRLKR